MVVRFIAYNKNPDDNCDSDIYSIGENGGGGAGEPNYTCERTPVARWAKPRATATIHTTR